MVEKRILLHILIEISGHDGYCSGNECEYSSESVKIVVPIPDDVDEDKLPLNIWGKYLDQYQQTHAIYSDGGSNYCDLSDESRTHGLDRHDIILRVTRCEVVQLME